jgi:beta-galactosidase
MIASRTTRLLISMCAFIAMCAGACPQRPAAAGDFRVSNDAFLLDGKPMLIRAGELHPCRIPPEYWSDHLKKARCLGLNAVAMYCFWNLSEPEPGQFNFTGFNDVARFVRQAQQEGLYVILRPGPYSCAERDFGGYPYWLLKDRNLKVRSRDERFLRAAARYMKQLGKQLAPLQITRGGPILMVQVENEYGSYAEASQTGYCDELYKTRIRDMIKQAGFEVPMFTSDGGPQAAAGHLPDALPAINGSLGHDVLDVVRKMRPNGPFLVAEFYPGGIDHWGQKHSAVDGGERARQLDWLLAHGVSFNLYMLYGGTNFDFSNGANYSRKDGFQPQPTTYDYDFLLDDASRPYPKFFQFRNVIAKHLPPGTKLPDLPPAKPTIEVPAVVLDQAVSLFDVLGKPVRSEKILSMEDVNQAYGYILYRTKLPQPAKGELVIRKLRDYGVVFLNGTRVAELDRRRRQNSLPIDSPTANATLDILVENMGRINFGPMMLDNRKGITEKVTLGGRDLAGWEIYPLPMTNIATLAFKSKDAGGPALYRGHFTLSHAGDTFLDMRGWGKGCVWINGHNLGRFWHIGPQQTLYVPGVWLKEDANEIVVFDLQEHKHRTVRGLKDPILAELHPPK